MTYREGDYYIDIVTKDDIYEAWIYTDESTKHYMFGMPKEQQSYFEFFQIVEANIDEYKSDCEGPKMSIVYYDGSELECSSIYVTADELIADDIYVVPLIEVQRIEESE